VLATLDPGHYRRVTYADGSEGVEEPGEVLGYFDAKGIKLPLDQDRKVRADNLTELEVARVFAKAGHPGPYHESLGRKATLKRSGQPAAQRQPDALDRAKQERDAERELRARDPEEWKRLVAERNREAYRRHLTESKDDLIHEINNPMGRR
jgi:hypothetical protein